MSKEMLLLVDALAREKNVAKDIVFAALESALASATKKGLPPLAFSSASPACSGTRSLSRMPVAS